MGQPPDDERDDSFRITMGGAGRPGRKPLPPGETKEVQVRVRVTRELYGQLWKVWSAEGKRGTFAGWIRDGFAERARRRER